MLNISLNTFDLKLFIFYMIEKNILTTGFTLRLFIVKKYKRNRKQECFILKNYLPSQV